MPFKQLGLSNPILEALAQEGYEQPTPIQAKAIPPVLAGRDLIGVAQTGTGKTAAFALPIIHRLTSMPIDTTRRGAPIPRALILSPTRELAAQIGESFQTYGRNSLLHTTVIFGGVNQFHQVRALHRGVDVLIATPGRLEDLMQQRLVNLTGVSIFVLDEADRMLDMGFINPIRRIAAALPKARQTLLFSATMPKEIMHLADALLKDPVKVAVTPPASTVPLIEQKLYMVQSRMKQALLEHLLADAAVTRAVVFTKTKHGADRVCRKLHQHGVQAVAIHGNKAQNYRQRALDGFRSGRMRVLVATDVAARGLDVDGITHVINFDLPMEPEAYVHRIGRTGRAGATGIAITMCDGTELDLLRQVQRVIGKAIPPAVLPNLPLPIPGTHADERPTFEQRGPRQGHRGGPSRGGPHRGRGGQDQHAPRTGGGAGQAAPRSGQHRGSAPANSTAGGHRPSQGPSHGPTPGARPGGDSRRGLYSPSRKGKPRR